MYTVLVLLSSILPSICVRLVREDEGSREDIIPQLVGRAWGGSLRTQMSSFVQGNRPSGSEGQPLIAPGLLAGQLQQQNMVQAQQQGVQAGSNGVEAKETAVLGTAAEIRAEARRVIGNFLKSHTVYEVLHRSGKVVVFGVDIPVKLAFYALTEHGIPVAPIWDQERNSFVGVFTLTDFVEIIRYFYRHGSFTESLTAYSIHAWRSVQRERNIKNVLDNPREAPRTGMISIGPEDSLYAACEKLRDHRIHYLPVLDSSENRVLATVAHLAVLQYLVRTFQEPRRLFDQSIFELGIGVFQNVVSVPEHTKLIDVLNLLSQHGISSVPVVEQKTSRVLDIYSRNMVVMLGKDSTSDSLLRTVGETVQAARASKEFAGSLGGFHTCQKTSSLHDVIMTFSSAKVSTTLVI